jgi:hypothetical protein
MGAGSRNNSFRGGKVHVKAAMCKTCIFRPGNLMHLSEGRREGMERDAVRNDSTIVCHSTLGGKANAVCRGFFDKHKTQPLRMAMAFGCLKEVE